MDTSKILSVGKELLKGNFAALKSYEYPGVIENFSPASYGTIARNNGWAPDFFWNNEGGGGVEYYFTYAGRDSARYAYENCPPLAAVINRKASAYINGKTWVMNSKGKEATSDMGKRLAARLKQPNPLQSWKQFEAQQKIYIELFGYACVMPIIPAGFEQFGPIYASSMWNIPPYMLSIKETNKLWYQTDLKGIISEVKLSYKGLETTLDIKNLYFFKDIPVNFSSLLFPESKVSSLHMPINNIIGALESRNVLINYRGALGILSPKGDNYGNIPLTKEQKLDLQRDFSRYGTKKDQWKFIISPAELNWQAMGSNTKDLELIPEVVECSKMICDAYNYPPHLMGLIDPTFNNQSAAEKGLYQNTIIPEAESAYEQWNLFFRTEEYNLDLQKDFSHLQILQEDANTKAQARYTLNKALELEFKWNMITKNRWLELLGEDRVEGGDVYYDDLNKGGTTFPDSRAQINIANGEQENTGTGAAE